MPEEAPETAPPKGKGAQLGAPNRKKGKNTKFSNKGPGLISRVQRGKVKSIDFIFRVIRLTNVDGDVENDDLSFKT